MLATLRKKLKGVSIRNRSLQDILLTCGRARRVISVESYPAGIHNTKLIVELPDGRRRVHFYSRLNLATILEGVELTSTAIGDIISELNLLGYDFTEDDLEIVEGILQAKPTSLGYIGITTIQVGSEPFEITCEGALPSSNKILADGTYELMIGEEIIATGTIEELQLISTNAGINIIKKPKNLYDL